MTKHAPAPWTHDTWLAETTIYDADLKIVARVPDTLDGRVQANARLIAASPTMLDALHKAFRALCEAASTGGPAFAGEIAALKDAITQAEGWPGQ